MLHLLGYKHKLKRREQKPESKTGAVLIIPSEINFKKCLTLAEICAILVAFLCENDRGKKCKEINGL